MWYIWAISIVVEITLQVWRNYLEFLKLETITSSPYNHTSIWTGKCTLYTFDKLWYPRHTVPSYGVQHHTFTSHGLRVLCVIYSRWLLNYPVHTAQINTLISFIFYYRIFERIIALKNGFVCKNVSNSSTRVVHLYSIYTDLHKLPLIIRLEINRQENYQKQHWESGILKLFPRALFNFHHIYNIKS